MNTPATATAPKNSDKHDRPEKQADNKMTNANDPAKKKALEAALEQIDKVHGKGSIIRLGEVGKSDVGSISTGSPSLDLAIGIGGVPRGRIVEIYGPESSGKTTLALSIAAQSQKEGGVVAFIDAEQPAQLRRTGTRHLRPAGALQFGRRGGGRLGRRADAQGRTRR